MFSSHFCFLVVVILSSIVLSVSFLVVVISPRSCFYYYLIVRVFHISFSWCYFTWVLMTESLQVCKSLLSILAVLKNTVVWMVSTCPPTSKSSSPFNNHLVTLPKAPMTIGVIVTFMFHSFFQFPSKFKVLIFLFTFLQFYFVISRDSKVDKFENYLFLLLIIIKCGLLSRLGDQSVCQSPVGFFVSFSWTDAGLCIYHLFVWSNLRLINNS